ncbi:MAG: SBBP repeat-containing protein, partial [Candidatus Neomarinimicrobiota bacterium]
MQGRIAVLVWLLTVGSMALGSTEDASIPHEAFLSFLQPADQDALRNTAEIGKNYFPLPTLLGIKQPRWIPPETMRWSIPERPRDVIPEVTDQLSHANRPVFVENRGQWPEVVRYQVRLGGMVAWITDSGIVYDFYRVESGGEAGDLKHSHSPPWERETLEGIRRVGHVVRMEFEGGLASEVAGRGLSQAYHNYFIGNDPSRWASFVPLFQEVVMEEVYPGISARVHMDGGYLRYDLVVKPGADLAQVRLRFDGPEDVWMTREGDLALGTSLGVVIHGQLLAYQEASGGKEEVPGRFVLREDGSVGFEVETAYPHLALVIDPLIYSTFLGSSASDKAQSLALDTSGNVYVTGYTYSSSFPTTSGAYDTSHPGGSYDAFVAKLSSTGGSLVYSTFLGVGGSDFGRSLAVDNSGNVYVTGWAGSGFPTTSGAYDTSWNGGSYDVFVAKLNSTGSSLIYSTLLGSGSGDVAMSLALDTSGNAYVTGYTNSTDFPTTSGAYDTSHNGSQDVFIAKLNSTGTSLIYSTFLGGNSNDLGQSLALDTSGNAYVTGYTNSTDFPTTSGAYDTSHNGAYDVFVAKLNSTGTGLTYSTFLGGSGVDWGLSLALDTSGNSYVSGYTESSSFPTTSGAYQTSFGGPRDVFVTKLNSTGTSLIYSTFLKGSTTDTGRSLAVDSSGNAYVTGSTQSTDFGTTSAAYDTTLFGTADVFVAKLNSSGSGLVYSTLVGGGSNEVGYSLALDASGNVYVTGDVYSTDFPTTSGAYDRFHNGQDDVFVLKLNPVEESAPSAGSAVVSDGVAADVDYQNSASTIQANWSGFTDNVGVTSYEWAIGTTSGGTDVQDWTSAGSSTSASASSLSLTDGTTYYVSVRAKDAAGNTSSVVTSDGVTVDVTVPTVTISSTVSSPTN